MYIESALAPMTMKEGMEGELGDGWQGYALVGTMPVTDEPEGPRI